jgi:hypothetical protein
LGDERTCVLAALVRHKPIRRAMANAHGGANSE